MVSVIKEICIFMIIAQAILFFVPGNSYGKYVRLLVGLMMILRLVQPLFQLLTSEEERREITERIARLEKELGTEYTVPAIKDNDAVIARSIEEELKKKLEECHSGYGILEASLDQEREMVVITLSEQKETGKAGENIRIDPIRIVESTDRENAMTEDDREEERLRKLYGGALGVEPERIEIVME